MLTKVQETSAGFGNAQVPNPAFSVEISVPVHKKLNQICTEENVTMKELASELLKRMFLDHRKESRQIAEKLRCHPTP
jgi:hypothetical protein